MFAPFSVLSCVDSVRLFTLTWTDRFPQKKQRSLALVFQTAYVMPSPSCFQMSKCMSFTDLKIINPSARSLVAALSDQTPTEAMLSEECPICLNGYTQEDRIIELPCKHSFHHSCILEWANKVRVVRNHQTLAQHMSHLPRNHCGEASPGEAGRTRLKQTGLLH